MTHQTPEQTIAENLENPKKGVNNMGEFEEYSLKDQIEAAKFLTANAAGSNKFLGMIVKSFGMPGPM